MRLFLRKLLRLFTNLLGLARKLSPTKGKRKIRKFERLIQKKDVPPDRYTAW